MNLKQYIKGTKKIIRHLLSFNRQDFPYVDKSANVPLSVHVLNSNNLFLEEKVSIGDNSVIMNPRAKFVMKRWSFSARELLVIDGNHMPVIGMPLIEVTNEIKDQLDYDHKYNKDIIVDEDVWIGARCILCNGCHVGRGAIIAAGAVVTHNVLPYSVVGGVPARFIKFKWSIDEILEHESKIYKPQERLSREKLENIFASQKNTL